MNRFLTSRLTAHSEIRQVEVSRLADAAALAVDDVVAAHWRRILATLGTPLVAKAQREAHRELLAVLPAAKASVADSLRRIARWGHTTARASLRTTLPLPYLRAAAATHQLAESLLEDTSPRAEPPGILELILRSLRDEEAQPDLRLRSPFAMLTGGHDKQKAAYLDLLFPPPPKHVVDEIVFAPVNGATWEQRLEGATRTSATPQQLADVVAQGVAAGKPHREIARDLLPVVDGVRSSARRIARTEGLRVAGAIQERAWDGLGDMYLGLQIRATLDERTRPAHRLRNGTIFYRDPKPGQLGMDQCPHPPVEADGTLAWNCFLPGTKVQGAFQAASKSRYSGEAVEIVTNLGSVIRATANHPILTAQGFVPANRLREGQHLLRYVGDVDLAANNEQDGPTLIEDVYRAFTQLAGVVSTRPNVLDLHGDEVCVEGDVDVVFAKSELPLRFQSDDLQSSRDPRFGGRGMQAFQEPRLGTGALDGFGVITSPACMLGGGDLLLPFGGVHALPFKTLRFGSAAKLDAVRHQNPVQADGGLASKAGVAPADPEFVGQLLHRFAGSVAFDYVVKIRKFDFSGHVYDLHSPYGVIIAENIVCSNCRCFLSPELSTPDYLDDAAKKLFAETPSFRNDPTTYADWFANADERSRRLAVGARRYEAAKASSGAQRPSYAQFVDPAQPDGLLSTDQIRSEPTADRLHRVAVVGRLVDERRELIRRVATLGLA